MTQAARRAKDVAAIIEAARVLTFLARERLRGVGLHGVETPDAMRREEIAAMYRTASDLATLGRRLAAEADHLLADSVPSPAAMKVNPGRAHDVRAMQALLGKAIRDAKRAMDILEDVQGSGIEQLEETPSAEQVAYVETLIRRVSQRI
ncbi:MAG TPA: hypothetical protein VFP68_05030 [Burkholderiaceae bacterium]|nr:hypothetical protein [Burkholderiaceae bacterium]